MAEQHAAGSVGADFLGGVEGRPIPRVLTKIVATIGPASDSPEIVRRLIECGVCVFRFNFSHGDFAGHERRLDVVRQVAAEMDRPVACLGDLQGPKIRVGKVEPPGIMLKAGQDVLIQRGLSVARVEQQHGVEVVVLPTTYPRMIDEVKAGQRVLINDGAIRMLCVEHHPEGDAGRGELRCRVTVGGLVTSGKGINLPQSELSAPAITEKDWECVAWAVENQLDYLALSFVRKPEEVRELKVRLAQMHTSEARMDPRNENASMPVIAKIEMPQALANLDAIVEAADGVMVARGDLGVEMDIAQVPVAQKRIIKMCQEWGKPCIVATQMLESMIESPAPTRAEASDVANAIFDGVDAVMLSAESASGKWPAVTVETMQRIIYAAEGMVETLPQSPRIPCKLVELRYGTAALAHGAWQIAHDLKAKLVVCWSQHGGTARYLSQHDFSIPIVAYTSSMREARRMNLLRGVIPVCAPVPGGVTPLADWNEAVDAHLVARGLAKAGDLIVLVAGRPLGQAKATNMVAIHRVGESESGLRKHRGAGL